MAVLYLQREGWDLEAAIIAYQDDERWEKEHPLRDQQNKRKGKAPKDIGMRRFVGGSG